MPRNQGTQCFRQESSTQKPNLGGEQLDANCPSVICPAPRHFVLSAFHPDLRRNGCHSKHGCESGRARFFAWPSLHPWLSLRGTVTATINKIATMTTIMATDTAKATLRRKARRKIKIATAIHIPTMT